MNPRILRAALATRRHFLGQCSAGLGAMALSTLLGHETQAAPRVDNPLAPRKPPFTGKAKHVIYLHMAGSPPHLDMFDYKPELVKRTGQDCPAEHLKGKRFAFTSGTPKLLGTPQRFRQVGQGVSAGSDRRQIQLPALRHGARREQEQNLRARRNGRGPRFRMEQGRRKLCCELPNALCHPQSRQRQPIMRRAIARRANVRFGS
jgi:hypothetical protein